MKQINLLLICLVYAAGFGCSQTLVDLKTQTKRVDFGEAVSTRPAKTGAVLPALCSTGEVFFLTSAPAGSNLWGCVAPNIWIKQAAGSGAVEGAGRTADLADCRPERLSPQRLLINACTFRFPNAPVRSAGSVEIVATSGTGTIYAYATASGEIEVLQSGTLGVTCTGCRPAGSGNGFPPYAAPLMSWSATAGRWAADPLSDHRVLVSGPLQILPDAGVRFRVLHTGERQIGIDTAVIPTRAMLQAGSDVFCSATGDANAQRCSPAAPLTAYTQGMRILLQAGADNTGPVSLNISSLGSVPLRFSDGTTELRGGELQTGRFYDLVHDGTVFRLAGKVRARYSHFLPVLSSLTVEPASLTMGDNGETLLHARFVLPPDWLALSGVTLRLFFQAVSAPVDWVGLQAQIACTDVGDTLPPAFPGGNMANSTVSPAAERRQTIAVLSFDGIAISGCLPGKLAHVTLMRDPADAYAGPVELLGAELGYWTREN